MLIISSCSDQNKMSDKEKFENCDQYLIDTGYDRITGKSEQMRIMKKVGVPKGEEDNFCIGRIKKQDRAYCYLALPNDGRLDGHYTDCPYDALR